MSPQSAPATGIDGIWVKDKELTQGADIILAFNSNQIKNTDNLNPTENEDVRYSSPRDSDGTIKKQIEDNSDKLNAMKPVHIATVPVSVGHRISLKSTWMNEQMRKYGGFVERQNFGAVDIGKTKIFDAAKYLKKDPEVVATVCVPYVIKRGIQIDFHTEHNGDKNVDSYTFAGPVVLNGVRGNMAVVVQRTNKLRYHVHRILLPNNAEFTFEAKKNRPVSVPHQMKIVAIRQKAILMRIGYHLPTILSRPKMKFPPLAATFNTKPNRHLKTHPKRK